MDTPPQPTPTRTRGSITTRERVERAVQRERDRRGGPDQSFDVNRLIDDFNRASRDERMGGAAARAHGTSHGWADGDDHWLDGRLHSTEYDLAEGQRGRESWAQRARAKVCILCRIGCDGTTCCLCASDQSS